MKRSEFIQQVVLTLAHKDGVSGYPHDRDNMIVRAKDLAEQVAKEAPFEPEESYIPKTKW